MHLDRYKKVSRTAKREGIKCRSYARDNEGKPAAKYLGRFMFGRNPTFALIVYRGDINDFEECIKEKLGRTFFADLRIDNLGLDYIIY